MKEKLTLRRRFAITRRGYSIIRRYCPGLAGGKFAGALIRTLQPFISIFFSAQIINELIGNRDLQKIIGFVSVAILLNLAAMLANSTIDKICRNRESLMFDWFGKIFADKQMSMDYVDLENAEIQKMRQQAEENLYMFGNGLAQLVWGITALVEAVVNIIASLALTITFFISRTGRIWFDTPIWIVILLGLIVGGGVLNYLATAKENNIFEQWCTDTVWYNRTFMFFGQELPKSQERAKDVRIYRQEQFADWAMRQLSESDRESADYVKKMAFFPAAAHLGIGIVHLLCYLFVVVKAAFGAFGAGSIVQYVGALGRLGEGIQGLLYVAADNAVYCRHLESLYEFLDLPNKKYQGTIPVEKRCFCDNGDNDYKLELRNVSFRYPGASDWALRNVSLKLHIGKRLAVVGQNGSGKTTLIKLLCRLYDPDEGEILLNGIDIRKYDYEEYMSIFSVVFQDFKLLSFPLGQNVAASTVVDKECVCKCLETVGFGARLAELPQGVNTGLYKNFDRDGVEISGGEAQKIALARALYRDAPIMILDEPTAALDPVAEQEIYSKFDTLCKDKTAIYISHRLSSCRFCDNIAVFHNGQMIQYGTHEQLLTNDTGKYYELWHAQAQYYQN